MAIRLPRSLFSQLGESEGEHASMPERIRALVLAEEWRSERMIGWVQLVIITIFGVLYALAPRPSDAMDAIFEPVPAALTVYALFTLVRIVAAYRKYLPGWFLLLSMIADVALLYTLIWAFHIAYHQPPAFYLKIPTFAYIFVFIAIRALRFDPRFVLTQGILAAVGWLLMVLYVVNASGTGIITRSFVDYLTGNLLLVGAELDKIFTVLLCAIVLSLAVNRARKTLLVAVREGAARRDMNRYFGAGVAEAITSKEEAARAGEAIGRDAAILMLDLRGFTAFASHHPADEVVATLTEYHRMAVPLIEAHGGVVDKFLGDGVMATFGALQRSDTAAADCLDALCDVMAAAPNWDRYLGERSYEAMPINAAAVAGRVVAATLGNEQRLEFTVIGGAANLAAKLEKHNKIMKTKALTDETTFAIAREQGFTGKGEPVGCYEATAGAPPASLIKLA